MGRCSKATRLPMLRWPCQGDDGCRNVPSLAGGADTSQCFQEILKIPALHKSGRAEDPREEVGSFLSARTKQSRGRNQLLDWGSMGKDVVAPTLGCPMAPTLGCPMARGT